MLSLVVSVAGCGGGKGGVSKKEDVAFLSTNANKPFKEITDPEQKKEAMDIAVKAIEGFDFLSLMDENETNRVAKASFMSGEARKILENAPDLNPYALVKTLNIMAEIKPLNQKIKELVAKGKTENDPAKIAALSAELEKIQKEIISKAGGVTEMAHLTNQMKYLDSVADQLFSKLNL